MHYLLIASILWGTSFIAGKYAEDFASPELVVLIRLVIASLFVSHIAIASLKQLDKSVLKRIIFVSFLTYPVTFLLQFVGLKYTTASNAVTMIGFNPLLVLLFGHFFFNDKATLKQLLLAMLAFVGVLLVMGKPDFSNDNFVGCLIVLLSGFAVAIWLQMSKSLMKVVPKGSYTPLTVFFGAILTFPSAWLVKVLLGNDWTVTPSVAGVSSVLYLGVGCSLMASWAWNKGVAVSATNISGLALALEPVFGVVFALILLGDRPELFTSIGIALVLFAILYSFWLSRR
ncbi:MAG: DMT family transporter [Moraxellaceae bacterium]|nr:DMT family transporter [Moraxellaceae bacterium]